MSKSLTLTRMLVTAAAMAGHFDAQQQPFIQLAGAPCATPPVLHCPDR